MNDAMNDAPDRAVDLDILRTRIQEFLDWAQEASGCDWCCGGGDNRREELNEEAQALGYQNLYAAAEDMGLLA